jgi:hypothetical protein
LRDNPSAVSAKQALNDPKLTRRDREHVVGIIERFQEPDPPAEVSARTLQGLVGQINAPTGDPQRLISPDQIYQDYKRGKLTWSDFQHARQEFIDARTPDGEKLGQQKTEFIKSVKPLIDKSNPLMGRVDQEGGMNMYRLQWNVDQKIDQYRREGKNPHDLFDPSKPDFVGRPENLTGYQKTLQESVQDAARRLTGTRTVPIEPPPVMPLRRPGETPQAYRKRINAL